MINRIYRKRNGIYKEWKVGYICSGNWDTHELESGVYLKYNKHKIGYTQSESGINIEANAYKVR